MTEPTHELPPYPPVQDTASLLAGHEIALLEVLFYLLDKGVIDKHELAARLDLNANNLERLFNTDGKNGTAMVFPARRIAAMLRAAVLVDEENNPI